MSDAKLVNIARLMTTYNFEIDQLPDNLKCAQCKLMLKDACHLPCCCRFCRVCIDNMIARGGQFCPGDSEDCAESHLSLFVPDYESNKGILRLAVKCPHDGCVQECRLANMEEHLHECQRKIENCPFGEIGCTDGKLTVEELGGHLQHENRKHSEILIAMIVNINKEIEMLKRNYEVSSREIETLKHRDEASSREIETLKLELGLKDGQIRSIMDQMIHVQNENKSIKNENKPIKNDIKSIMNDIKSIKEERDNLAGRVTILTEEIAGRRENNELDSARVIEHVDREIAEVTRLIGSNNDEMQSVKGDIGYMNQSFQVINDNICSVKSQVKSIQALVGLGQFDASFVWLIDVDVVKANLSWDNKLSEYFTGAVHPYKYRLGSLNTCTTLGIVLRVYAGPNDAELSWPFEARVVMTITDRDRHEACSSISRQCRIERPLDNDCSLSGAFWFRFSELIKAGLNLNGGARVSCVIVPGAGQ